MGTIVIEMVTDTRLDAGSTLFGVTRRAVLGLLLGRPDEKFHLRQIVRLSGAGVGPVQRELAALAGAGIVRREQSGRQVYFQADATCPIFVELQALIQKVSGAAGILREALQPLASRIRVALIFGSVASGTMQETSDVDLLVVSDDLSIRDMAGAIREASARLGRDVNINLYRPAEWAQRAKDDHPLVRSILNQKTMTVIGDEHELERLAKKRMDQAASARPGANPKAVRGGRARPSRRK